LEFGALFEAAVAQGRNMTAEQVKLVATGQVPSRKTRKRTLILKRMTRRKRQRTKTKKKTRKRTKTRTKTNPRSGHRRG
jgi:hypothetical protein